jgi:hypothetical protein
MNHECNLYVLLNRILNHPSFQEQFQLSIKDHILGQFLLEHPLCNRLHLHDHSMNHECNLYVLLNRILNHPSFQEQFQLSIKDHILGQFLLEHPLCNRLHLHDHSMNHECNLYVLLNRILNHPSFQERFEILIGLDILNRFLPEHLPYNHLHLHVRS